MKMASNLQSREKISASYELLTKRLNTVKFSILVLENLVSTAKDALEMFRVSGSNSTGNMSGLHEIKSFMESLPFSLSEVSTGNVLKKPLLPVVTQNGIAKIFACSLLDDLVKQLPVFLRRDKVL